MRCFLSMPSMARGFRDDTVTPLLQEGLEDGVFPGAALLVSDEGQLLYHHVCGDSVILPERSPATAHTRYDLASLTKPIVTSTLAMRLCESGILDLAAPVRTLLPEFSHDSPRVSDLLSH